jgi:hypothetical protein
MLFNNRTVIIELMDIICPNCSEPITLAEFRTEHCYRCNTEVKTWGEDSIVFAGDLHKDLGG